VTLNQLRTFLAVAETGSVRAAAQDLVVTQAAVSASLAALQKSLGVAPHLDGSGPHSADQCETVMSLMLLAVMSELLDYEVDPAAVVLTPTMALPGRQSGRQASPAESAEATVRTLAAVPLTLAGVAFAADSQRAGRATEILAAMQSVPHIWPLTFAFGRALTGPALAAWGGRASRWEAGQRALAYRVAVNVVAMEGRYTPERDLDAA
jgi:fructose-bisphosphate aldolase, class I